MCYVDAKFRTCQYNMSIMSQSCIFNHLENRFPLLQAYTDWSFIRVYWCGFGGSDYFGVSPGSHKPRPWVEPAHHLAIMGTKTEMWRPLKPKGNKRFLMSKKYRCLSGKVLINAEGLHPFQWSSTLQLLWECTNLETFLSEGVEDEDT